MSVPDSNSQNRAKLSFSERSQLFQSLTELPDSQFEELLFSLEVPLAHLPNKGSARVSRISAVLSWAQSSAGPGLFEIQRVFDFVVENQTLKSIPKISDKSVRIPGIPYNRNPLFTGREELINQLEDKIQDEKIVVLKGLAGIGKTQVAIEFTYRKHESYNTILWTQSDSLISLVNGFTEIAKNLNLLQGDFQDSENAVRLVKNWLRINSSWLLILDDLHNKNIHNVKSHLPHRHEGDVLITSRHHDFQLLNVTHTIEIRELLPRESVDFLLKRVGCYENNQAEIEAAEKLAVDLGHLPLALEQAGAYISAKQARIEDYQKSYQNRRIDLLEESIPAFGNYLRSVASSWALNFSEVEKISTASADVLYFSSFLNPDNIPFELLIRGMNKLGPELEKSLANVSVDPVSIYDILEPLNKYSLIRINQYDRVYSVHRLVQEVLQSILVDKSDDLYKVWAERTIRAVSQAFPTVEHKNWNLCESLLTHVKAVNTLIEKFDFNFETSISLLSKTGMYLSERARFSEAQPFLEKALELRKGMPEKQGLKVADSMHHLAVLYWNRGYYSDAEPLFREALSIKESFSNDDDTSIALSIAFILHDFAVLYHSQGKYKSAEPLFLRSLRIRRSLLGQNCAEVATSLHNIGNLYKFQGQYEEAENRYILALEIRKSLFGQEHRETADSLNNLALLYHYQGRYDEAESLFLKVIELDKKNLGGNHPDVATSFNNIALVYMAKKNYEKANYFFLKSRSIREEIYGEEHPHVAQSLNNIAELYEYQERYEEAKSLYVYALDLERKTLGSNHPDLADSLNDLARLCKKQGDFNYSRELYSEALTIARENLGENHPYTAASLYGLGSIEREKSNYEAAGDLITQALAISKKTLGIKHPKTIFYTQELETLRSVMSKQREPQKSRA